MAVAQRFVEGERAVGGACDADARDAADRRERGQRLVITQTPARLGVEMHRRRPAAGKEKRVAIARLPAGANRFDAAGPDDALDSRAARHFEP